MAGAADTFVHPSAILEDGAQLGEGVHIGPFCHVSADAVLGDRVRLISHVSIPGATTLGEGCIVHPTAVLGAPPQNFKHKGSRTELIVGRDCVIREGVTMHAGSDSESGETRIGNSGYFMNHVHIGHDCRVGDGVVIASGSTIGGHVEIGDRVNVGGLSAIHQFVRIGHSAFIAGMAAVVGDVIPYGMAVGNRARLRGLNVIGLRRAGRTASEVARMRQAYRAIFSDDGVLAENLVKAAQDFADFTPAMEMIDFLSGGGKRHLVVPARKGRGTDDHADAA